jgi:hypothetical protein
VGQSPSVPSSGRKLRLWKFPIRTKLDRRLTCRPSGQNSPEGTLSPNFSVAAAEKWSSSAYPSTAPAPARATLARRRGWSPGPARVPRFLAHHRLMAAIWARACGESST